MREELLETEAIEMPATDDGAEGGESVARPLPARRGEGAELSIWRDEVRTAAREPDAIKARAELDDLIREAP